MKRFTFTFLVLAALLAAALPTGSVLADTDTLGPLTSAVAVAPNPATVNTLVTVTATVDDTTTGGSTIQSAEFNVNGGTWTAMTASDGGFDGVMEGVTGSFTVEQAGDNNVCVRGTDALGNLGTEVCATLTGEYLYTFSGFRPPVRMGRENWASAPRAVPVKWNLKLTDGGAPVSDPASFVAAWSYEVDCTSLTGDPASAVEAKTAGKSGLRYLRGGNWIFNWKTEKSFGGTCRMFYVEFSDGQLSPEVLFHFR